MGRIISKHLVTVYDLKPWRDDIEKYLFVRGLFSEGDVLSNWTIGIVEKADGTHYLIDTEGVGSEIPLERERAELGWMKSYKDGFDIFPCAYTRFDMGDLKDLRVLGHIPLHTYVRVFGSRLDHNVYLWDKFLSEK